MRNLKKFLALVLATMMLLSVAVISTSAADEADYTDAAKQLAALQVLKGDENGNLMLDKGVTRYQAALFFVQALTGETEAAYWNAQKTSAYFTDVPEYGTAIDHAYGIGLILGRGNGVYGYNDPITYQDMLVMAVRALGYETEDMSYPYGYILAAQKLGLTENVEQVNYKAALTRGETAQIIWDMLDTEIAITDPLSDKILYPGDEKDCLTAVITKVVPERTKLLVDSGLAGAQLVGTVAAFEEADEDDEDAIDLVTVNVGEDAFELAAADFGIDAETRVVDYLGLPVEFFISEDEFDQGAYDDGDLTIVSVSYPEYTVVTNLGDAGDVKYVTTTTNNYFSFGGEKFAENKYDLSVLEFGEDGWEPSDEDLATIFAYDSKDGYTNAGNTYAQVAYRVTDTVNTVVDDKGTEDEEDDEVLSEKTVVEVLYTPLSFGQYNVRDIDDVKYTVIGVYSTTAEENMDEVDSYFVEYLVDAAADKTATAKITSSTKTVGNKKGEAASTVVVEGEAVEAGDFMFYAYNSVDNVLTVAANAGTFETGRLTAQNSSKKTVKIGGTNYEVGFTGQFPATWASATFNAETNKDYIAELEAGMDNVKFLVVDGNVVYMEPCKAITNASEFDFAIVTTDEATMMELLDITSPDKYAAAIADTKGLYVEDGYVKVAMMNLTTGEWELVSVDGYSANWEDTDESETRETWEFVNEYTDLADAIKYYDITGNTDKYGYIDTFKTLVAGGVVAVVDETDGVYTLADNETLDLSGDEPDYGFFVAGTADEYGISFSDNSTKTNAITADDEIDKARVSLDEESVIVVVDADGAAGSRVGVQSADNSVKGTGYFLAASADLIVFVADTGATMVKNDADVTLVVAEWADAAAANSDENWYITTLTTGVEIENNEDDDTKFNVTITDVYDMKAGEIVEFVQTEALKNDSIINIEGPGYYLFKNAQGEITECTDLDEMIVKVANDNDDKLVYATMPTESGALQFNFIDNDTIEIAGVVDAVTPVDVEVKVVTLNLTGLDPEDYDFDAVVSSTEWTEGSEAEDVEVVWGEGTKLMEAYALDNELVQTITEPTEGVVDEAVLTNAARILVPEMDNDDYSVALNVNVELYGAYCVEDGVANIVIYKLLTIAED